MDQTGENIDRIGESLRTIGELAAGMTKLDFTKPDIEMVLGFVAQAIRDEVESADRCLMNVKRD